MQKKKRHRVNQKKVIFLEILPARSTLNVSQTLTLKSSYPAMSNRPDLLKATLVTPQMMLSWEYWASSWSALMSYSLTVASSEPVQKAVPCGKNYGKKKMHINLLARLELCPKCCNCDRRSRPLKGGPSGKRPPRWCRKWCCRGCTWLVPGRCGCRTDGNLRRPTPRPERNR